jgi:uncharacterized Zn finger protein
VSDDGRRIGHGPWARLFANVIVGDEGSREAEHGRQLVGEVEDLRVEAGELEARVEGCTVTIATPPIPPRVWEAIRRFARGNHRLEAGVEGREQSVHLMHLMEIDWDEPLIPRANAVTGVCACGDEAHVAAVAYAAAARIDDDPGLLLRWRGATEAAVVEPAPLAIVPAGAEAWVVGTIPPAPPLRPLPVGAVLQRLGSSGVEVGSDDLAEVLRRAYAAFAKPPH